VVVTARIACADAADIHLVGWSTDGLVAITSLRAGLHHVDHLAALVEATPVNGPESWWLGSRDVVGRSWFRGRAARDPCCRPNAQGQLQGLGPSARVAAEVSTEAEPEKT
jgi:hypothetical protein